MPPPPQSWNAERYAANARFVSDLAQPLLTLLSARRGERILDLGCGDGVLSRVLAEAGCAVIGVDTSRDLLQAARARGVDACWMDGQALAFEDSFDAVFSNAALHWMKAADRVIAGVRRALKPGGRYVAEMGGYGNVAQIVSALERGLARRGIDAEAVNPWYFPTEAAYSALLCQAGFSVVSMTLVQRPTRLPGDITGWLETFAGSFASALPAGERGAYLAEVRDQLAPLLQGADGRWIADYVRLRFHARKPEVGQ